MSITRKWAFARAEHIDDNGITWIAEARVGTGTWVIRDNANSDYLRGKFFAFHDDDSLLLTISARERRSLGMDDKTYTTLNVALRADERRRAEPCVESDMRLALLQVQRRLEALENQKVVCG